MKKILSFSMVLLALTAFSPKPASAAPDTGPKVGNIVLNSISASAAEDITCEVVDQGNIETNIAFISTSGRETLVDRPDHTDGNRCILNPVLEMMTVSSNALAAVVEPERRTCASNVMKDTYNDLDPSKTAAGLPLVGDAQHSRHMVWVLKRPAWTMPRYLRC